MKWVSCPFLWLDCEGFQGEAKFQLRPTQREEWGVLGRGNVCRSQRQERTWHILRMEGGPCEWNAEKKKLPGGQGRSCRVPFSLMENPEGFIRLTTELPSLTAYAIWPPTWCSTHLGKCISWGRVTMVKSGPQMYNRNWPLPGQKYWESEQVTTGFGDPGWWMPRNCAHGTLKAPWKLARCTM